MFWNLVTSAGQLLVGQLSGVDQVIGGLSVLIICAIAWLISWQRRQRAAMKPGMASLSFIILASLVALIAIGATAYGIGLRSAALGVSDAQAATESEASQLVGNIKIVFLGDPKALFVAYGTFERTGKFARVYVDFDFADRDQVKRGNDAFVTYPRRVKLRDFTNFGKGEEFKVVVASYDPPTTTVVMRWGAEEYGVSEEADRFTPREPIDARLVITDDMTKPQQAPYLFWLRPKFGFTINQQPVPTGASNLILMTESMITQTKWK